MSYICIVYYRKSGWIKYPSSNAQYLYLLTETHPTCLCLGDKYEQGWPHMVRTGLANAPWTRCMCAASALLAYCTRAAIKYLFSQRNVRVQFASFSHCDALVRSVRTLELEHPLRYRFAIVQKWENLLPEVECKRETILNQSLDGIDWVPGPAAPCSSGSWESRRQRVAYLNLYPGYSLLRIFCVIHITMSSML